MRDAHEPTLAAVDLNLLVALDALLQTESVTAAGRRIGLTQPATSRALARLRELLGDELLVREGRVMRPTELGRELAPVVRRLLGDIEATLLRRNRFDPRTSARTFRLAANDYCGAVLLPRILEALGREAPGVYLDVFALHGPAPGVELARGELDLGLGTYLRVAPPLASSELAQEGFACLVRRGHPLKGRLTLARYAALEHLLVASPGYGPGVVDFALEAHQLRRRIAARVPHFLVAPAIVERTDLVVTLPRRVAVGFARPGLRVLDPPLELETFPVQLVWHERSLHDAGVRWLRSLIERVARSL